MNSSEAMRSLGDRDAGKALTLLRIDPYVRDMTEFQARIEASATFLP